MATPGHNISNLLSLVIHLVCVMLWLIVKPSGSSKIVVNFFESISDTSFVKPFIRSIIIETPSFLQTYFIYYILLLLKIVWQPVERDDHNMLVGEFSNFPNYCRIPGTISPSILRFHTLNQGFGSLCFDRIWIWNKVRPGSEYPNSKSL